MLHAGLNSSHGMDGSLSQKLLACQNKLIEELQGHSRLLMEMRDNGRKLLKLQIYS